MKGVSVARGVLLAGAVALLSTAVGPAALADSVSATAASNVKYRHAVMHALSNHMSSIAAIAKGDVGHAGHMAGHAAAIAALASMTGDVFPEGSGGDATRAKDEIWRDAAGFEAAVEAFRAAAAKLLDAAEAGDAGAVGAALGGVGRTCGGCHRAFRKPRS